jgi:hypothetical protein
MADKKISALPAATTPLAGTEELPIVQSGTTDKVTVANLTAGRAVSMKSAFAGGTAGSLAEAIRTNSGAATNANAGITVHAQCADTRYNWLIGAQYNLNQGFEITPSTAVGGGTFSTPAWSIDAPTGNVTVGVGNLIIGTSGKGIDFSATPGTGTSELLSDYEEGAWTPAGSGITLSTAAGRYIKIGQQVTCWFVLIFPVTVDASDAVITGLPFTVNNGGNSFRGGAAFGFRSDTGLSNLTLLPNDATSGMTFRLATGGTGTTTTTASNAQLSTFVFIGSVSYIN